MITTILYLDGTWQQVQANNNNNTGGYYYNIYVNGIEYWIISYTIWNWLFVIQEYCSECQEEGSGGVVIALLHLEILIAPIIGCFYCYYFTTDDVGVGADSAPDHHSSTSTTKTAAEAVVGMWLVLRGNTLTFGGMIHVILKYYYQLLLLGRNEKEAKVTKTSLFKKSIVAIVVTTTNKRVTSVISSIQSSNHIQCILMLLNVSCSLVPVYYYHFG